MTKRGRKSAKAKDDKGYLDSNKDKFTDYKVIQGNKITMEGVSGKIFAIPIDNKGKAGQGRLMKSGENHVFEGASHIIEVPEVAMAQIGIGGTKNLPMGVSTIVNDDMYQTQGNTNTPILTPEQLLEFEKDANLAELDTEINDVTAFSQSLENQPVPEFDRAAYDTKLAEEAWEMGQQEDFNSNQRLDNTGNPIEQTEKIQFDNPYGGVDIPTAAQTLGASFSYDGDMKGANTARGIASGLKLLTGLGRNVMTGYAQNKRNQWVLDEYNRNQKNALRKTENLQSGGNITSKDLPNINDATDLNFDFDTANSLFATTPSVPQETTPSIDFGRYKDVGYFELGEMHNGKRTIYNTSKNPMNYDDNRRNALRYLQELNGADSFEFVYRNRQERNPQPTTEIASMQKGGEVTAADLLTGTVATGNPNAPYNVEVEDGEHIKDNRTGRVKEVVGDKHSQGGEKMNLEDHKVLSDYTKIGGDLAKKYRDEFDIKVKAKDTYATVMDKILRKTGYKSITDELTSTIEKTQEEQEKAKKSDSEATTGINMQFLSGKIHDLTKDLEPLEEMKSRVFETLFADQQGSKSLAELREEGQEMQDGGEKKVIFKEGDNPNEFINPDAQHLTSKDLFLAGTVTPENYKETMLQLLEEFPNLVQENFEVTGAGDNLQIKPRFGQDSVIGLQEGINAVYDAKIAEAENITDPVKRQEIIDRLNSEKFNSEDRYKGFDGLIGNFTASRRNFTIGELMGETSTTSTTEAVVGENEEIEGNKNNGSRNRIAFLPNQYIMPPSTIQPHRLAEITPREAEAKLISPNAQLEEINRQAQSARAEINSLPDSQRRAALAQLNAQTQQSINQVMSQTNRANAQIEGQTQENNIARASQADLFNEQAADLYEKKILTAKDNTEQEIRNYFNAQNRKQVANFNTIQNMNLTNAMYDNFQYDGNGRIIQTGKGIDEQDINSLLQQIGLTKEDLEESEKRKSKTAKRGRKIK